MLGSQRPPRPLCAQNTQQTGYSIHIISTDQDTLIMTHQYPPVPVSTHLSTLGVSATTNFGGPPTAPRAASLWLRLLRRPAEDLSGRGAPVDGVLLPGACCCPAAGVRLAGTGAGELAGVLRRAAPGVGRRGGSGGGPRSGAPGGSARRWGRAGRPDAGRRGRGLGPRCGPAESAAGSGCWPPGWSFCLQGCGAPLSPPAGSGAQTPHETAAWKTDRHSHSGRERRGDATGDWLHVRKLRIR